MGVKAKKLIAEQSVQTSMSLDLKEALDRRNTEKAVAVKKVEVAEK